MDEVSPIDRLFHWQQVYEGRSPTEVSWYQAKPVCSLQHIEAFAPSRESIILDVGAGASLLVDHLLERGYRHISLLDIAESSLKHVRQRLGAWATAVEWFYADILEFVPPHPFELWHDRAVFHFLTRAEERTRYLEVLRSALRPGGHVVLATFAVGGPTRCSGLDVRQYDEERVREIFGSDFVLVRSEPEQHRTPSGAEQLFIYFVLQCRVDSRPGKPKI